MYVSVSRFSELRLGMKKKLDSEELRAFSDNLIRELEVQLFCRLARGEIETELCAQTRILHHHSSIVVEPQLCNNSRV